LLFNVVMFSKESIAAEYGLMIRGIGQGSQLNTAPIIALRERSFPNEPACWSGQIDFAYLIPMSKLVGLNA
jgi:hypothetical protein